MDPVMNYLWVPLVVVEYFLVGLFTVKNNHTPGWGIILWISGALPIWSIISKYSSNLVFDGLVFDVTMVVTYTLTVVTLTGSWAKLSTLQYCGLGFVLTGLYLFRKDF